MSESLFQQQPQHQEQNALLDQLHNSVLNTRQYAIQIGGEIGEQDEMLDQLHGNVARTTDESRRQNHNIIQLLRESKSRGFYSVIIVLVVIVILLLMI